MDCCLICGESTTDDGIENTLCVDCEHDVDIITPNDHVLTDEERIRAMKP